MVVMRIHYQTLIEAIRTVINGGGAALNLNLSTSVQQVLYGDPTHIVVEANRYPTVIVHLRNKRETWETLGNIGAGDSGIKRAEITFDVYALVMKTTGSDDSDKECRYLADNIEGLIRNDVKLTNLTDLLWIEPTETNFIDTFRDGVHLSSATITFMATMDVQRI